MLIETTEQRLQLLQNGYTPLPNIDKICVLEGWPKLVVDETEIRRWRRMLGYESTGLRLDGDLIALDFDINVQEVTELYDILLDSFPELSGAIMRKGKGYKEAWFLRCSDSFSIIRGPLFGGGDEGLRVEVFGSGSPRQFGALGWHTKDERMYSWVEDASPLNVPLSSLPLISEETVNRIVDTVSGFLGDRGYDVVKEDGGKLDPSHVYDLTEDMVFETRDYGDLTLAELRETLGGHGYTYCSASWLDGPIAKNRRRCSISLDHDGGVCVWDSMSCSTHHEKALGGGRSAPTDTTSTAERLRSLGATLPTETVAEDRGWQANLIRNADGVIRINETNVALILTHDPAWAGTFKLSDFDDYIWVHEPLSPEDTLPLPRRLRDVDVTTVLTAMQSGMMPNVTPQKVRTGLLIAASWDRTNGPKDYLLSLKWDGRPRLKRLPEYLCCEAEDVEETAYQESVLRMWMISAVARILSPGCKADHMLVLQGAQGMGKSQFFHALAGEWFGDDMPPIGLKDTQQWLGDKWIVEVAELSALSGKDIEHVKAFITVKEDSYRKPYGSVVEKVKRHCIFGGTTNDEEYLLDPTGGRRFWPVIVGKSGRIRVWDVAKERDQLWAEAVAAYHAGELWYVEERGGSLDASIKAAQEGARSPFLEERPIREWLRRQPDETETTSYEVALHALKLDYGRMPPALQHRIPRILSLLGWSKVRRSKKGAVWTRGPKAEPYEPLRRGQMSAEVAAGITPDVKRAH